MSSTIKTTKRKVIPSTSVAQNLPSDVLSDILSFFMVNSIPINHFSPPPWSLLSLVGRQWRKSIEENPACFSSIYLDADFGTGNDPHDRFMAMARGKVEVGLYQGKPARIRLKSLIAKVEQQVSLASSVPISALTYCTLPPTPTSPNGSSDEVLREFEAFYLKLLQDHDIKEYEEAGISKKDNQWFLYSLLPNLHQDKLQMLTHLRLSGHLDAVIVFGEDKPGPYDSLEFIERLPTFTLTSLKVLYLEQYVRHSVALLAKLKAPNLRKLVLIDRKADVFLLSLLTILVQYTKLSDLFLSVYKLTTREADNQKLDLPRYQLISVRKLTMWFWPNIPIMNWTPNVTTCVMNAVELNPNSFNTIKCANRIESISVPQPTWTNEGSQFDKDWLMPLVNLRDFSIGPHDTKVSYEFLSSEWTDPCWKPEISPEMMKIASIGIVDPGGEDLTYMRIAQDFLNALRLDRKDGKVACPNLEEVKLTRLRFDSVTLRLLLACAIKKHLTQPPDSRGLKISFTIKSCSYKSSSNKTQVIRDCYRISPGELSNRLHKIISS